MDYSKAFATISHQLLLAILYFNLLGVDPVALFYNYLYNRHQCVTINNNCADPRLVLSGVPQGSVLKSIFFDIYTYFFKNASLSFNIDLNRLKNQKKIV